jgi:hypothetical protein
MAEIEFHVDETAIATASQLNISANFAEAEEQLRELMAPYATLLVTEDTVSSAKADLAKIRKVKASLDDYRKSVKKAFTAPVTAFESKIKVLTGVCEEAESNLSGQINTFVEQQKQAKIDALHAFFDDAAEDVRSYLAFEQVYNPRWGNATFAFEEAQEEIRSKIAECVDGVNTIRDLGSPFEASLLAEYKQTHNLAAVMKRNREMLEIQRQEEERREAAKRKAEEEEAIRKARQEAAVKARQEQAEKFRNAIAEANDDVDSGNDYVEPTKPTEPMYEFSFRIRATRQQLIQLKQAFTSIGLQYSKIE